MFKKITLVAVFGAATTLAGCGDTEVSRGVTGAAAGAVVADVPSNNLLTGALIGAPAGVLSDDVMRGRRR